MLWAACCLGFFGFLPAGEFTVNAPFQPSIRMTVSDLQADALVIPTCFKVYVKCSKIDPFRMGCDIYLGRYLSLDLKVPRAKPSYVSIRSYKNYNPAKFLEDLQLAPFHMVNFFDDVSDQVDVYNILFLDVLNEHAPIRRIKIKAKPNPFVPPEIKQLMKTRDNWHKSAMKTNDKLHWNAYKFFKQEVKREIRLAERTYVKSHIINSKGNTNSIWKVINQCLPKKSSSLPQFNDSHENMANNFNK